MATIHTYGDSNTYGIGDPEGGGYATRLRITMIDRIMSLPAGRRGTIVHNLARFGMSLPGIVEVLPDNLANRDERGRLIATAMIGFIDSGIIEGATEPTVPLRVFRNKLQEFTTICQAASYPVLPIFIESPPVDLSRPHPKNTGDINPDRISEYQDVVRKHAKHTGATFIDTHPTLQNLSQDPLSKDGIHLSIAGHIAVHELLLGHIDELLSYNIRCANQENLHN